MATPKTSLHTRSISLPSTSHPLDATIENHFGRLRVAQAEPSSSSTLTRNLSNMKDLHEHMNDFIHLPHNLQILSNQIIGTQVDEVLDGSVTLLDISSTALDALSQTKESILDLKSAFRRGSYNEGINTFAMSRKKINKDLSKFLVKIKKVEQNYSPKFETDGSIISILKEAETISIAALKSLVLFLMGSKETKVRGWSLVNKLMKSKRLENATEVECLDQAISDNVDSKVVMKHLETLEMVVLELEKDLEFVSRCFVKTRVSLLNILNH